VVKLISIYPVIITWVITLVSFDLAEQCGKPSRGGANDLYFTCKQYKHHGITIIRAPRDPYISISSTIESQLTWLHCIKSSYKSSTLKLVSTWPKTLWSSTKNAKLLLPVHPARKAKDNATRYYRPALGVKGSLRCRPKSLLS
jgi:hypothetical protein